MHLYINILNEKSTFLSLCQPLVHILGQGGEWSPVGRTLSSHIVRVEFLIDSGHVLGISHIVGPDHFRPLFMLVGRILQSDRVRGHRELPPRYFLEHIPLRKLLRVLQLAVHERSSIFGLDLPDFCVSVKGKK